MSYEEGVIIEGCLSRETDKSFLLTVIQYTRLNTVLYGEQRPSPLLQILDPDAPAKHLRRHCHLARESLKEILSALSANIQQRETSCFN